MSENYKKTFDKEQGLEAQMDAVSQALIEEYGSDKKLSFIIDDYSNLQHGRIDKLLELVSVEKNEFYPRDERELKVIRTDLTGISLFNAGTIEKEFFSNIIENREKIKVLLNYFKSTIDYLNQEYEGNEKVKIVISIIKSVIFFFSRLVPDIETPLSKDEVQRFEKEHRDKRFRKVVPTINEKLKALTELCPEFIKRLHKLDKEEQKQAISLITGVNKVDAYKKVMTKDIRELEATEIKYDGINLQSLKIKLNKT